MIAVSLREVAQLVGAATPATNPTVCGRVTQDSREVEAGSLFVAITGERVDGHDYIEAAAQAGAVAALAEREVEASIPVLVVADAVAALARLATEVLVRERDHLQVVAITGSHGKTSVKDLVRQLLEHAGETVAPIGSFNNELGLPLTVLGITAQTRFLVLEMGARGIGHIAHLCRIAPPDVAAVLNVGSAHAGEFGGPDNTALAKSEIVTALEPGGTAVLNADDARVAGMADLGAGDVLTFGVGDTAGVRWRLVDLDGAGQPLVELAISDLVRRVTVPLVGGHQASNAAAAVAIALAAGISADQAIDALAGVTALSPMRMERINRADGVTIINDAYNANPESMAAALEALVHLAPDRGIALIGGMLELGDDTEAAHRRIGVLARELGVAHVVAIGDIAAPTAEAAGDIGVQVGDFEGAVSAISGWLDNGTVVLLKASRGERLAWDFDLLTSDRRR